QSPDRTSVGSASAPKKHSASSRGRRRNFSSSTCKDFLRKFVDSELLTSSLEDWFSGHSEDCGFRKPGFNVPFELTELQNFDYALEGVTFQQLRSHSPEIVELQEEAAVDVKPHETLRLEIGVGKDLVSNLVSGLLTIGPCFGGAIDDAARYFKDACDSSSDTCLAVLRLLMISPIWVMWVEDLNTYQMFNDRPEPEFINILTSIESHLMLFRHPRARRGSASAHSLTSPGSSATSLCPRPSSFEPRPCPHSLPHLISRSPAPARALLTPPDIVRDPCPPPRPSSSPDTAPSHPELHPKVRHLYPCSVSPISLCGRPISASSEFGCARVVTAKLARPSAPVLVPK
ncbi:hypothetical protein ACJX0J_033693, partial [Zea mays]